MKQTLLILSCAFVVSATSADTIFARAESKDGREPSYSFGYCTSEGLEAWAFALPSFPIVEVGYSHYFSLNEKTGVLTAGYVSRWTKLDQWYLEPVTIWFTQIGDLKVKTFWGAYAPLNGGSWQLFNEPTNVTLPVTPDLDLGIAGTCWFTEGTEPTFGFGPMATWRAGDLTLSARALAGVNQPNSLRLELTTSF